MPNKSTTYSVPFLCSNCGKEWNNKIKKGESIPKLATCPNCEVKKSRPTNGISKTKIVRENDELVSEADDIRDEEYLKSLNPKDREQVLKQRSEAKATEVIESLTSVHENAHPENGDPTKRFIVVGSNIINKRKEIVGYVRASEESFEQLKAQFAGKKELQEFLARIKIMPQTLCELYGVKPEESYCLEMLDRKWEHKRRNLPELPVLPALTDGDYDGYKKSLGIID